MRRKRPSSAARAAPPRRRLDLLLLGMPAAYTGSRAGRPPGEVTLVAVTKTASMDQIREVVSMGQLDLGENRVQQLMQRAAQMSEFLDRAKSMPSLLGSTGPVPAAVRGMPWAEVVRVARRARGVRRADR